MRENTQNHLDMFDYFGFPSTEQRAEARNFCDIEKLTLKAIDDTDLLYSDTFLEQYDAWRIHINNFRSHLELHFLLMYYQYEQKPLDILDVEHFESPEGIHKTFFDTFAEDVALYLISYLDKHLEMFNDLFHLSRGKKHPLSRHKIIYEMEKADGLQQLAETYKMVEQSKPFATIKAIRDNFVHNKSSSHSGIDVRRVTAGEYASFNNKGISSKVTYTAICELIRSYEQLCVAVNDFVDKRILDSLEALKAEEASWC